MMPLDLAGAAGAGLEVAADCSGVLDFAGTVGGVSVGEMAAGLAGAVSIFEVGGVVEAGAALISAGFCAGGAIWLEDFLADSGTEGGVSAGFAAGSAGLAGEAGALASAGGRDVRPFSAAKAASAVVMGARSDVPLLSGGRLVPGSAARGASGGVARSVTASRCDAEAIFEPVTGGALRRSAADFDGSGTVGSVTPGWTEAGRPGIAGGGVSFEVGASPEVGGCVTAAAGFGGTPVETAEVGGLGNAAAGTDAVGGFGAVESDSAAGFCEAVAGTDEVGGFGVAPGKDDVCGFGPPGMRDPPVFCGALVGTGEVGGLIEAEVAGTEDVGGFVEEVGADGAGVKRNEAVGGRTLLVGGFVDETGAAAIVCCGGRVSGISTGPGRRAGVGSVVRRIEPVGGRTLLVGFCGAAGIGCEGPNAGGSGPVEGRGVSGSAGACGLAAGSVVSRIEPVGGRMLLVDFFGVVEIGCEGPNAGGNAPVDGRGASGSGGASDLATGSGSVGWREAEPLVSKREVVGRVVAGTEVVGGFAPERGGSGLVAGAREPAAGVITFDALGSGSVAGRAPALRGIICAEGILPPGSGGSPPVGARDDARWLCDCDWVCDGGRGGTMGATDPLAGRAGARGGTGLVGGRAGGICTGAVEGFNSPVDGFAEPGALIDGSGVVGGRVAASRCICEVIAREIAADAALGGFTDGSGRVAGRAGAGSVVRRSCAVGGRAMLTGGFGASVPGFTLAGRCGAGGGIEPEADGPSVKRICPVWARRGGTTVWLEESGTEPVAGRGSVPERGSNVTRGTDAVAGGFGASGRAGGGVASSDMG